MIVSEDVLFIMPRNREYLFPAMSAMQSYIHNYDLKMRNNCVLREMPTFSFRYDCDIADEDWAFFQALGIELKQGRESIGYPDSVIDLSLPKILSFRSSISLKHCAQICAAIAGVEAPPFPKIRFRKPDFTMQHIFTLQRDPVGDFPALTAEELLDMEDGQIGCVVAHQGWETYMIAAQALPVIEIIDDNKQVQWLSKWSNPVYRALELEQMDELLPAALESIRRVLTWQSERDQAVAASKTQMDHSTSSVPVAASTSDQAL